MKKWMIISAAVMAVLTCACSGLGADKGQVMDGDGMFQLQEDSQISQEGDNLVMEKNDYHDMDPMLIVGVRVGDSFFTIDLEDNSSAEAFLEKIKKDDLVVDMSDYGGFEKVGELPWVLPTNDSEITTKPGDIILYQGNKITIYYGENTWNFTKLGELSGGTDEDIAQWKEVFGGKDDIKAEFFVEWTE